MFKKIENKNLNVNDLIYGIISKKNKYLKVLINTIQKYL